MTVKLTTLITAAALALAACSQQAETSVAPDSAAPAASTETAVQSLTSSDGAVTINTAGNFADQSGNAELMPEGFSAEEITLLQRDEQSGITLYAAALGSPKTPSAEYFAKLKTELEKAENLSNLKIGAATENRMDYSFTQDNDFQEDCIALHTAERLYTICANGSGVPANQLAAVLKDVKLK